MNTIDKEQFQWTDELVNEFVNLRIHDGDPNVETGMLNMINRIRMNQFKEINKPTDTPKQTDIDYWRRELKKCQDSPYYFFTKYWTVNGMQPTIAMSEKQFNEVFASLSENHLNQTPLSNTKEQVPLFTIEQLEDILESIIGSEMSYDAYKRLPGENSSDKAKKLVEKIKRKLPQ